MEYNEGDIAEDGNGNFMVFRRGQWHPSNAEGVPMAPIPAPEWGEGAVELPDGTIQGPRGPRGGQPQILSRAAADSSPESLTAAAELRGRLVLGLGPISEAQQRMEAIEAAGYSFNKDPIARGLDAVPGADALARLAGGNDYQQLETASRSFESAMLPVFSGAAVTDSEARRFIRANLPSLGDTAETRQTKARNRRLMVNAAATLLGQELPYPDLGVFGAVFGGAEQEIPYAEGAAAADRIGLNGAGPGTDGGTQPPPPAGPTGPVDISGMSAAELLELEPGTEIRLPDGTVTRLTGRPEVGADGEEVSPGVFARRETPEQAVEARREGNQVLRRLDAGVRGAADMMSFGFADEIAAAGDTIIPLNGGVTGWEAGFPEAYRQNVARERAIQEADAEDVPVSRGVGQVAGAVGGGAAALRGASALPNALRLQSGQRARNILRVGAGGAGAAGLGAAGNTEGGVLERGVNALRAAPVGAVVAPVAGAGVNALSQPAGQAARFIGGQINRGVQASGRRGWDSLSRNALDSGVDRMAGRVRDTNALSTRADEFRQSGIEPTFADVTDSSGRGQLRALATRQTPGRQVAEDFATGRAEAMPSRVSFQARRTISDDPRSPQQLTDDLTTQRDTMARTQYAEPYAARVPIDDDIRASIGDEPGRAAIRSARQDAIERQDMEQVAELDGLLSGDAQDISGATLDRLRIAMRERGTRFSRQGRNARASGAFSRKDALESAIDAVPDMAEARGAYRDVSQQIDAVETGGQFLGANTDEFVSRVNAMSPEARRAARIAAARQVELAAQNPGRAPGVARSLYANPEQARRSQALLGDDANRLSQGMRAEADALEAAREVNPRGGSNTNLNREDSLAAAGEAVGTVRDVATGNVPGLATRAITWARSRGFSDAEAEAIIRASVDPSQTNALIDMLAQRMTRREARSAARAARFAVSQSAGEGTVQ